MSATSDKCKCGAFALDWFIGTYATHDSTHTRERCQRAVVAPCSGCPWCGARPTVNHNLATGWNATCVPCRAMVGPFPSEAEALAAWDERQERDGSADKPSDRAAAEKLAEMLRLILPLAKGYAYEHQVGSNMDYIREAHGWLVEWDAGWNVREPGLPMSMLTDNAEHAEALGAEGVVAERGHPPGCRDFAPPTFSGRWRDWHRGHGCNLDDGKETAVTHGLSCPKAFHDPRRNGYLHGPGDDTPYDVDGVLHCGRCHEALS